VLAWLWDTIAEPILAHLAHTAAPADEASRPRIWWCPVGVLAFLPLHAAGHYTAGHCAPGPDRLPRAVPDLVVSSYTPTVRALAQAQTSRPSAAKPSTMIVPVAGLPGAELPGVATEAAAISSMIPEALTLSGPTRSDVLRALPAHDIAHFACHGHIDWLHPAASRLILTDHASAPLTLTDIADLRLDADLAYLSACNTAVTAGRLADESLHITGAFRLAGYRHVIGTLWPIADDAAAQVATDFYRHLTADGTTAPRPERAAAALHHATTRLRSQYPRIPSLWAAYTHTGI
jgi:CHAT domain-containing protein